MTQMNSSGRPGAQHAQRRVRKRMFARVILGRAVPMQRSFTPEIFEKALLESEVETMCRQHLVITRDRRTGLTTYSGPFPTGLAALEHAELLAEADRVDGIDSEVEHSAAPLFAP